MLVMLLVKGISGYDGLYGQDPYAYYNYARAIQAYWQDGTPPGAFVWPRIYPLLGALWMWGDPGPWMQFLSMAGSCLMLGMTINLLRMAQPQSRYAAPAAFLFIGLAPFLLRNSLSILSDTPALGLMTWALWQGERYLQGQRPRHLLCAGLLTGLAIWTRYPVALLMALPCLLWMIHAARQRQLLPLLLFIPVMLLASIPHFWLLPHPTDEGVGHVFQNSNFVQWSPWNAFQRDFQQQDGHLSFSTPNLVASLGIFWHPRYLGIGGFAIFAWLLRKRWGMPRFQWASLGSILVYSLFLAGVPFQNARFHLLSLPFAGKVLAPAWDRAATWIMQRRGLGLFLFGLIFVLQLGMGIYACRALFATSALEQQIAAELRTIPNNQRRLYEFSLEAMLKARGVGFEKVNLWYPDIPAPRPTDLLIFNLEAFGTQFQGKSPMKNWEFIQSNYKLRVLKQWEGGWQLYEIQ